MSIHWKLSLASAGLAAAVFAGASRPLLDVAGTARDDEARKRVQTVLAFQDACREYVRGSLGPALRKAAAPLAMDARSPTTVARAIFDAFEKRAPGHEYREAALDPLNPANQATAEEKDLIRRFEADSSFKELVEPRVVGGKHVLYAARPLVARSTCLECHGSPDDAPAEIVARYGRDHGFRWEEGAVAGLVSVVVPVEEERQGAAAAVWAAAGGTIAAAIAGAILAPLLFSMLVGKQLRRSRESAERSTADGAALEAARARVKDLEARLATQEQQSDEFAKKLERGSLMKSRFLADMSHEIRSPIGSILGYTEILEDPTFPQEERKNALVSIRRNGQHLIELINNILDLSKIEAGSLEIEKVECSVNQLVKDVLSVMSVRAHGKGLRLDELYLTPVPSRIVSDPVRIRQILINLVGNAVKFTERGLVTLSLKCSGLDGGSGRLEFAVQDTGIGIPREKLGLLFRPFQQLDSSTTRKFGGTGLGLTISKELARLLGGDIEVKSEPGMGSIFTLSIRCEVPAGATMNSQPSSAAFQSEVVRKDQRDEPQRVLPALKGRVLVVDDGNDNRKLFRYHLEGAGATVETAENGSVAVQKAAGAAFDVILMDIQMPVLDGFEALRELRAAGNRAPIVALTAHAMKGDRERCVNAGFDDYISKPVSRRALLEKVAVYLKSI